MAHTTTKYSRNVSASVDYAGARAFFRMSCHVALDLADELLEEVGAIIRWRPERLANGATQHLVGRRDEYGRLEIGILCGAAHADEYAGDAAKMLESRRPMIVR